MSIAYRSIPPHRLEPALHKRRRASSASLERANQPQASAGEDCWATQALPRQPAIVPAAHEWWTRRAALGASALCASTGIFVLTNTCALQTPLGAMALYAYEQARGPHAGQNDALATLHDWAVAEGMVIGAQVGAIGLITLGFLCAAYAAH